MFKNYNWELIKVERAVADLIKGVPLIINDYLVFSAEAIKLKVYQLPSESSILKDFFIPWQLLITKQRIEFLLKNFSQVEGTEHELAEQTLNQLLTQDCFIIDCKEFDIDEIEFLIGLKQGNETWNQDIFFKLLKSLNDALNCINKESYDSLVDMLLLTKIGESIPALMLYRNKADELEQLLNSFPDMIKISTQDIKQYNSTLAIPNYICNGPLLLNSNFDQYEQFLKKKNIEAEIRVFRCGFKEHYAILFKKLDSGSIDESSPLVRIHSSCFTGDLLRSIRCDCHEQLHTAIEIIAKNPGGGVLLYLNQEGRGIGLSNKLRAYYLQVNYKLDTVEANTALGFSDDDRSFISAANILKQLGLNKINLLTNNPNKLNTLKHQGIEVNECIPHYSVNLNDDLEMYYKTKIDKLGHSIKNY